mmetsp:Transcript_20396/g.21837  ORF Transcript_20396/g.21837 Transcript_20396/m.21837 type:complete len:104 (+) Transcript_20396:64-375(+)
MMMMMIHRKEDDDDDDDDDDGDDDDDDDDYQKFSEDEYKHGKNVKLPVVVIAKIDCVEHTYICNTQEQIRAYPTYTAILYSWKKWQGRDRIDGLTRVIVPSRR